MVNPSFLLMGAFADFAQIRQQCDVLIEPRCLSLRSESSSYALRAAVLNHEWLQTMQHFVRSSTLA